MNGELTFAKDAEKCKDLLTSQQVDFDGFYRYAGKNYLFILRKGRMMIEKLSAS